MQINIKEQTHTLPMFLPDGTHGVVKALDSIDLSEAGVRGVVVNTYHLLVNNAVEKINELGGIKKFMNFNGLVITDSGGFQAMSLVRRHKGQGKITDDGVKFKNFKQGGYLFLTPELCIETQLKLGSDIIMLLDDCTDPTENMYEQNKSVDRTIAWAKRAKVKFEELTAEMENKPMIFGIIQGGNSKELRQKCAEALIKIGFDGYAFGGWPMQDGVFLDDIVKYTAEIMPSDKPRYAMGVGKPVDIQKCLTWGYNMFDCVLPTRDARHQRLYINDAGNYRYMYINKSNFEKDNSPVDANCDCHTCKNFTRAYLHHLFKSGDITAMRLATIHNLFAYNQIFK